MAGKRLPILADERGRGVLSYECDMNVASLNHPSTVGFKSLDLILSLPFHRKWYLKGAVAKKSKGQNYFNTYRTQNCIS